MHPIRPRSACGILLLGLATSLVAQVPGDPAPVHHGYMHPTAAERWEWAQERKAAPVAQPERLLQGTQTALPSSFSLLSLVPYDPVTRDQGSCGDCWVWASTAMTEVAMNANFHMKDRLSTQFFNSGYTTKFACNGGTLTKFANWYNTQHILVPWSNPGAAFADGVINQYCTSALVPLANITTTPRYTGVSITPAEIDTSQGQAKAISDIKTFLNNNQAVGFSFWTNFDSTKGSGGFDDFWNNKTEADLWINAFEGGTWNDSTWGGHMVTIVGYDETDADPSKHYWIVLNSWSNSTARPSGLFRMPMQMNYDAIFINGSYPYSAYEFEVLTLNVTPPTAAAPGVTAQASNAQPLVGQPVTLTATVTGAPPFTYQWRKNGTPITSSAYTPATFTIPCADTTDQGAYDVVVTNASGSATSTALNLAVTGQQLVANPGFESGDDGTWKWTSTLSASVFPTPIITGSSRAHIGKAYAYLGYPSNTLAQDTGSLEQTITIPAGTGAASLGYWLKSYTYESAASDLDTLTVKLLDGSGNLLRTLKTHTNQHVDHLNWAPETFDVSDLRGRTVKFHLDWQETGASDLTLWRLDDVFLTVASGSTPAAPVVSGFTPTSGPVGTAVTISGTGFTGASAVTFNGTAATTFNVTNDTTIAATVPAGATNGTISVTTAAGTGTSTSSFTVTTAPVAPVVSSFTPTSGPVGTPVTISGTGFTGATAVKFGGPTAAINAAYTVVNDTTITTSVPVGATNGTVSVTTAAGTGTSTASFTVTPTPVVSIGLSPKPTCLVVGGTQAFIATVTGSSNTNVNWTATGGTLSATTGSTVIFTAQATAGTATVTATAAADATKSDHTTFSVLTRDVSGDGSTDVADFATFAKAYGSHLGDTNYVPAADLNGDGAIDDSDITIFFAGF